MGEEVLKRGAGGPPTGETHLQSDRTKRFETSMRGERQ